MNNFYDLKKQNSKYFLKFKQNLEKIFYSGFYISGIFVRKFEKKFSELNESKYTVAVGNGFDSIRLSLEAFKILGFCSDGDEVIVPANSYIATMLPVNSCNLKPVFVEPEDGYFTIDLEQIKKKITKKTKVIIVTHLYGHVADMEKIVNYAKQKSLKIIEDCSQSHGAKFKKKFTGNFGDTGCFSLFPAKNLGGIGDGGILATNSKKIYKVIKSLRNYGESYFENYSDRKYINSYKGLNSRMDEINASLLIEKIKDLKKHNEIRNKNASYYLLNIKNSKIILPKIKKYTKPVWHQFIILTKQRDKLKKIFEKNNIETKILYPVPPHKQKAYKEFNNLSFPITEKIHKENLSLPVNYYHKKKLIKKIIKIINYF